MRMSYNIIIVWMTFIMIYYVTDKKEVYRDRTLSGYGDDWQSVIKEFL